MHSDTGVGGEAAVLGLDDAVDAIERLAHLLANLLELNSLS